MRTIITTSMLLFIGASIAIGQEDAPSSDRQAVSSYNYTVRQVINESEQEVTEYLEDGTPINNKIVRSYRSSTLRANFIAQWMFIRQNGRIINFWGARIVRLEADSPLRALGVRSGDVITRLDGIQVWKGMYKEEGQPWQLIQMEEHFGQTEVRFINQGTQQVRVGQINLDSHQDDVNPLPP